MRITLRRPRRPGQHLGRRAGVNRVDLYLPGQEYGQPSAYGSSELSSDILPQAKADVLRNAERRATPSMMLRGRRDSKILHCQQCTEWDPTGLECCSAALKSIDNADGMHDLAAEFFHPLDSLQRTAAGGHNVIDDHDFVTRLNRAFDVALSPGAFGFFPNHETLERAILGGGSHEHSADDRICSDRHPAKTSEFHVLQQGQQSVRNLHQPFGTERDLFAI